MKPRYGLAQINHYALGSMESFLVKVDRGKPNHTSDPFDIADWSDRNFNTVEDKRILRFQDAVTEGVAKLRQDPQIDHLHSTAVAWRKDRIAILMQESDSFYMMARLRQMPATDVLDADVQVSLFRDLMTVRRLQMARKAAN
jgi:hypothetical protein